MAPHDFVEIRLVCKADYLDPQLKVKLHEIKHRLREILHTGISSIFSDSIIILLL